MYINFTSSLLVRMFMLGPTANKSREPRALRWERKEDEVQGAYETPRVTRSRRYKKVKGGGQKG